MSAGSRTFTRQACSSSCHPPRTCHDHFCVTLKRVRISRREWYILQILWWITANGESFDGKWFWGLMLLLDSDSTFLRGCQVNKGFSAYRGNKAGGTARVRPPMIWWQMEPSRTSTAWCCLTKRKHQTWPLNRVQISERSTVLLAAESERFLSWETKTAKKKRALRNTSCYPVSINIKQITVLSPFTSTDSFPFFFFHALPKNTLNAERCFESLAEKTHMNRGVRLPGPSWPPTSAEAEPHPPNHPRWTAP